ncbi:MAG: hypothetical protein K2F87_00610 [Muribaculaceae bacterium]|nr:hypothetical protein [Muribaculaceae bacterium]
MKRNNSASGTEYGKIAGLILLALIWVWLVYMLFTRGGVDLKNLFIAVASGIIIFVPLWKRYIQPILTNRRKN